jgi:glycyl-tRNA synthetase
MTNSNEKDLQVKIVSLSKRRGFVFPGSEIYGGHANTYDYGPLGVLMLRNIISSWWDNFITKRTDMYGLDTSIIMAPQVWEASGHTKGFTNDLLDCKECKLRTRADHVIEDYLKTLGKEEQIEGEAPETLDAIIAQYKIPCPKCGKFNWTKVRKFNQLFETHLGILEDNKSLAYLRGEIAQGMFVNFRNVLDTMRPKLPFGIAQSGKAFRNEITLGNFIFRTLEFNLAEFEYFFDPKKQGWQEVFEYFKIEMKNWIMSLGVPQEKLKWRIHSNKERAFYSTHTEDLDFQFPFGFKEMFGLAYRTDYDLKNHMEKTGVDLNYMNPETGEKFIPHCMEPTFGISRVFLVLLANGYVEEADRVVLKLAKTVAPYRAAVFPLVKNKEELVTKAKEIYKTLVNNGISTDWDDRGNIGKRYYTQDEIGTPSCITVDYQTLEDDTVTIRDRDTMKQERVKLGDLLGRI